MIIAPDALVALVVLIANDRLLKGQGPGWLTGKLSDVAGLYLFPLVVAAVVAVMARVFSLPGPRPSPTLAVAAVATVLVFAAIKVSAPAGDIFQTTFGWLRWPLSATESWLAGDGFDAATRVELVRDPTDLVALPMAGLAWVVHRRPRAEDRR